LRDVGEIFSDAKLGRRVIVHRDQQALLLQGGQALRYYQHALGSGLGGVGSRYVGRRCRVRAGHGVQARLVLSAQRQVPFCRGRLEHGAHPIVVQGARVVGGLPPRRLHRETYAEDWLVVDAFGAPDALDHVEFSCDPRRPSPRMPAPGGRTRWEFMLHPGEDPTQMASDRKLHQLLAPWQPGRLRIERSAVYRFHARCCESFSRGRIFLAGDAAHVTPPFVGQGLVSGPRDRRALGPDHLA
jgi:hypothetical protein